MTVVSGILYPITPCINKYGSGCDVRQGQVIGNGIASVILQRYVSLLYGPRPATRDRGVERMSVR